MISIREGQNGNYGSIRITHDDSGAVAIFKTNRNLVPLDTRISVGEGENVIILEERSSGCKDEIVVYVECTDDLCPDVFGKDFISITTDCNSTATYCIDVPLLDISDYTFMLDGHEMKLGDEELSACTYDTMILYSYFTNGSLYFGFLDG
jgi:hypothetical protein